MSYQTIQVRFQEQVCFLKFHRPDANNTISDRLVEECGNVLAMCEESVTIVVLEGLPEVFCLGADFQGIYEQMKNGRQIGGNPEPLYDLWFQLATGPYITISHVRGKANAGGVGFVAASDIVIADQTAQFSLSELLFGLLPACVMPFLVRKVGFQNANYMTLMTQPVQVQQAQTWGLVDAYEDKSEFLLHKHLLRLRYLSKIGIRRYKHYMSQLYGSLIQSKTLALEANREVFSDSRNLERIYRYIETGQFSWGN